MGTSGQSFGAFAVKGVLLELEGDSQERKDVSHGGHGCWGFYLLELAYPWKSNHHFYRLVSEPPLF